MKRRCVHSSVLFLAAACIATQTSCCFTPVQHPTRPSTSSKDASASASPGSSHSRDGEHNRDFLPSWLETPVESERHPARHGSRLIDPSTVYGNDWRVERYNDPEPTFPDTVDSLTDAAWEAIAGTLYGKQRLDPNIASNAMSSSVYSYRPVRQSCDAGRIGLEIDGAQFLNHPKMESSGTAMRRVALQLGAKLSAGPWRGFEEEEDDAPTSRPVAIYFNTIKQSLIASQELLMLKQIDLEETGSSKRYDNITILCLQQDHEIPKHMQRNKKRAHGALIKGTVDPTQGLILVVQPTDYNSEFRPPGPSIGTVEALQQLVARASVDELPTVLISPRFLAHEHHAGGGLDQSGYQRSAVFGGAEPPKGPTPWLMRDFTPPVFSWLGCGLSLSPRHGRRHTVSQLDDHGKPFHYSRVACTQSVMHEGHPFNMFAVKEYDKYPTELERPATAYQYLASTKTSSGRPPKEIIRHVFNEWS
jgi:hypothetical protein